MLNKKVLSVFIFLVIFAHSLEAKRLVHFINNTGLPESDFLYFFFSWHSPDSVTKSYHNLGLMNRFQHFPHVVDLDQLTDIHPGGQPIPRNYIVDLEVTTNRPSGLSTKTFPANPIPLTGKLLNVQPITYSAIISDFKIKFIPEK
jgi:hypothetical protein